MNMHTTPNTLGPLRELPPEVSLEQVAHMVADFPLVAAGPASWFTNINLNSILMTSAGTLIVGGTFYLLNANASTASVTKRMDPEPVVVALAAERSALEAPAVVFEMPITKPTSIPAAEEPQPVVPMVLPQPALITEAPHTVPAVITAPQPDPKSAIGRAGRTFDLKNFNTIELHGHVYVVVEQGDFSVRAMGEEHALERLHLEVGNGVLSISSAGPGQDKVNCQDVEDTKVIISLPDLSGVEVYGSGTVTIGELRHNGDLVMSLQGSGDLLFEGFSGLSGLSINLTGSGDVVGKAEVIGVTTVMVSGSGDVHIAGTTREIDLSVIGSGDLDASELSARQGKVAIQGSGDVHVKCSGPLEQNITGSGDIHQSGNAGTNRQRGVEGNTY